MSKLEPGTLVMLKSGCPTMTVTSMRNQDDGIVHCEWFAGNELKRDAFDAVNLTTSIVPWASPPLKILPDSPWPSGLAFPAPLSGVGSCAACRNGGVCGCTLNSPLVTCAVSNTYGGSEPSDAYNK